MGKGKARTATHRKVNRLLEESGKYCKWWDDGYSECLLLWSGKTDKSCQGNPFICKKLYLKYLASVKKPDLSVITNFEQRDNY